MKVSLKIDLEYLQTLYLHTRSSYGNISFLSWVKESEDSYRKYASNTRNAKTYSQWVNGQIIALTS